MTYRKKEHFNIQKLSIITIPNGSGKISRCGRSGSVSTVFDLVLI